MKMLSLCAALALAGCATVNAPTSGPDARLAQLEEVSREIAERERNCVNETVVRTDEQIALIAATPDISTELRTQGAKAEENRELSECAANADREKDELSARERTEYEGQAREEYDRAALMMILTTSKPPH